MDPARPPRPTPSLPRRTAGRPPGPPNGCAQTARASSPPPAIPERSPARRLPGNCSTALGSNPLHQPRSDRIQDHVPAEFQEMPLLLDQHRPESALKEMPSPAVPPVEPLAVPTVQRSHPPRQPRRKLFLWHGREAVRPAVTADYELPRSLLEAFRSTSGGKSLHFPIWSGTRLSSTTPPAVAISGQRSA